MKAVLGKHLIVTVDNKVGTLAQVTSAISSSGINLVAICAYAVDNTGIIMFVSEDNVKAQKLLKAKEYNVRSEEAILLSIDNKPGVLQSITEKIAESGVDLTLIYGSVEKKEKTSSIVMISENNKTALKIINAFMQ